MALWPRFFLVAELDGILAGFLICSPTSADPTCGWVLRVRVSEGMRRKGIATAMMLRAHELMKQAGIIHLMLSCSPANEGALALYSRLGYIRTRFEAGYFGEGEDRLILIKKV
jgi:ribosomal protein S18 acetylase RimI-like enzyme